MDHPNIGRPYRCADLNMKEPDHSGDLEMESIKDMRLSSHFKYLECRVTTYTSSNRRIWPFIYKMERHRDKVAINHMY